jgi:hypothetical protein
MGVTPALSVDAFFHEMVSDVLADEGVEASPPTEVYLVGLLGEFTRNRITDEPLVFKLAAAQKAPTGEQVRALKEVGDTTLYVSGFFSESLQRQLVATNYYIGLGEAAYSALAARLAASQVGQVYRELSAKFPAFVEVLAGVRAKVHVESDVVSLYQQWLDTRAEWIQKRLRALGLIIPEGSDGSGYVQ